ARFNPTVSAPSSGSPAACSASAMRAPGASVTSPGACTSPTTLTTTASASAPGGPDGVDAVGAAVAEVAICTGGNGTAATGSDRSRSIVNPVIITATAAISINSATPARPGSARTRSAQPGDSCGCQPPSSEAGS